MPAYLEDLLDKINIDAHPLCDVRGEEIKAAYQRIDELEKTLAEARDQIEYLQGRFKATASGECMLGRIDDALEPFPGMGDYI